MLQYWQELFSSLRLELDITGLVGFVLLAMWLWMIWPAQQLAQLFKQRQIQVRALWMLMILLGLWILNASIKPLLHLHFLGLVVLMLMFSWRLASLLALLPAAFYCLVELKAPLLFGAYGLMAVCLPIYIAFVVQNRSYYLLPKNPFVLIFVAGFVNGALSQITHIGLWGLWLWGSGLIGSQSLWDNYLSLTVLMMFPEALLNGMAVTLLLVYRPEWLAHYTESDYTPRSP